MGTELEVCVSLSSLMLSSLIAFLWYILKVCAKSTVETTNCYEKLKGGIECHPKEVKMEIFIFPYMFMKAHFLFFSNMEL